MDTNSRAPTNKWVSMRVSAHQTHGHERSRGGGGAVEAARPAPPQPRSSAAAANAGSSEVHASQHTNSTTSNNSLSTTGKSSPTVQAQSVAPQHPRDVCGGAVHGAADVVNNPDSGGGGRYHPWPANANYHHNNAIDKNTGKLNGVGAPSRRQHAGLYCETGEVAPPQPRSVQMGAKQHLGAGAAVSAHVVPNATPSNRPVSKPKASYIPTPRHGAINQPNQRHNSSTNAAAQPNDVVASRWARLGGLSGPNSAAGNQLVDATKRPPSGSPNGLISLSASSNSGFSKTDMLGFGGATMQATAGGHGGSPFMEGLTAPSARDFAQQQQQQQLTAAAVAAGLVPPQFAAMQQPGAYGLTGTAPGNSDVAERNHMLLAAALATAGEPEQQQAQQIATGGRDFGGVGSQSSLLQQQQQQREQSTASPVPNVDMAAILQILSAAMGGGGGDVDPLLTPQEQQAALVDAHQGESLPPQPHQIPQQQPADLMAMLAQADYGDGAAKHADCAAPVSLQDMVELLTGAADSPASNGDRHTTLPLGEVDSGLLLAGLSCEADRAPAQPQSAPPPQQQQGLAGTNQFFDFSRVFASGLTSGSPNPPAPATPDPITASLFSQMTGEGDVSDMTGDLASLLTANNNNNRETRDPVAAAAAVAVAAPTEPSPMIRPQRGVGSSGVGGATAQGMSAPPATATGAKRPQPAVPQPRSANLRDLFSELTQPSATGPVFGGVGATQGETRPSAHAAAQAAPRSNAWPSLAALEDRSAKSRASSVTSPSISSRPISMAEAVTNSGRRGSTPNGGGGGGSSVWRQVASHGASTTTHCNVSVAVAPGGPPKELSGSANSNISPTLSGTPGPSSSRRPASECGPAIPAPASMAMSTSLTEATTPLTGGGRNSQPHTPAGAAVRLHRASLDAPTVTRSTIACLFRETPQSMRHRETAVANRDEATALCRARSWPPTNEVEVEKLLKSKDAGKLLRHLTIIGFSRQHIKGVQELFDAWARNGIPAPDMGFGAYYFYVKEKSDKLLCMKHNGRGATPGHGYGKCDFESRRPNSTCRYEHVCLFCRSKEHGWFEEGKCEGYQQLLAEVEALGVLEQDVEVMLNALEKSSAWAH